MDWQGEEKEYQKYQPDYGQPQTTDRYADEEGQGNDNTDPLLDDEYVSEVERLDRNQKQRDAYNSNAKRELRKGFFVWKIVGSCIGLVCVACMVGWIYLSHVYKQKFKDAKCEYYDVDTAMQIQIYGGFVVIGAFALCIPVEIIVPLSFNDIWCGVLPTLFTLIGSVVGFMMMIVGSAWQAISVDCDPFGKTGPCAEKCPEIWGDIKYYSYMSSGFWVIFIISVICWCYGVIISGVYRTTENEKDRLC